MKNVSLGVVVLGAFFFLPTFAFADSVAFVEENHAFGGTDTQTTDTWDITGAGTHVTVVAGVSSGDVDDNVYATDCSWNGDAMSQVGTTGTGGVNGTLTMWYLPNADVGNYAFVCNYNASITAFGAGRTMHVYSGTADSGPNSFTSPANKTGNFTVSTTPTTGGVWLVLFSNYGGTGPGPGTTQRQNTVGFSGDRGPIFPVEATTTAENTAAGTNEVVAGAIGIAPFVATVGQIWGNIVTFFGFY